MEPYKKMYFVLFHAITNVLQQLPARSSIAEQLRQAQQQAEELYISHEDPQGIITLITGERK